MPIRFRCAYCNQLLGISRRKAGKVVRCPTCAGQVIVPPSPSQANSPPSSKPAAEAAGAQTSEAAPNDMPLGDETFDVVPLNPNQAGQFPAGLPAPRHFIALTFGQTALWILVILLLLGVAFGAGYFLRQL